jgi:hypothetical protein
MWLQILSEYLPGRRNPCQEACSPFRTALYCVAVWRQVSQIVKEWRKGGKNLDEGCHLFKWRCFHIATLLISVSLRLAADALEVEASRNHSNIYSFQVPPSLQHCWLKLGRIRSSLAVVTTLVNNSMGVTFLLLVMMLIMAVIGAAVTLLR